MVVPTPDAPADLGPEDDTDASAWASGAKLELLRLLIDAAQHHARDTLAAPPPAEDATPAAATAASDSKQAQAEASSKQEEDGVADGSGTGAGASGEESKAATPARRSAVEELLESDPQIRSLYRAPRLLLLALCQRDLMWRLQVAAHVYEAAAVAVESGGTPSVPFADAKERLCAVADRFSQYASLALQAGATIVRDALAAKDGDHDGVASALAHTFVALLLPTLAVGTGHFLRASAGPASRAVVGSFMVAARVVARAAELEEVLQPLAHPLYPAAPAASALAADRAGDRSRPRVVESAHPYAANSTESRQITVPGATHLVLQFDPRCESAQGDSLTVFDEMGAPACAELGGFHNISRWPSGPMVVVGCSASLNFVTGTMGPMWGYRVTVTPLFLDERAWSVDLHHLALVTMSAGVTAQLAATSVQASDDKYGKWLSSPLLLGGIDEGTRQGGGDRDPAVAAEDAFLAAFAACGSDDATGATGDAALLTPEMRGVSVLLDNLFHRSAMVSKNRKVREAVRYSVAAALKHCGLVAVARHAARACAADSAGGFNPDGQPSHSMLLTLFHETAKSVTTWFTMTREEVKKQFAALKRRRAEAAAATQADSKEDNAEADSKAAEAGGSEVGGEAATASAADGSGADNGGDDTQPTTDPLHGLDMPTKVFNNKLASALAFTLVDRAKFLLQLRYEALRLVATLL